jgi:hypothetical protein
VLEAQRLDSRPVGLASRIRVVVSFLGTPSELAHHVMRY